MNDIETKMIHWEQVVAQQQQSGQTIKDFCQQKNIQYQRFFFWKKRLLERSGGSKLIKLNSSVGNFNPGSSFCELVLRDGSKVIFHQQPEVNFLKALLG